MNHAQKMQSRLGRRLLEMQDESIKELGDLLNIQAVSEHDEPEFDDTLMQLSTDHSEISEIRQQVLRLEPDMLSDEVLTRILEAGVKHGQAIKHAEHFKSKYAAKRMIGKAQQAQQVVAVSH